MAPWHHSPSGDDPPGGASGVRRTAPTDDNVHYHSLAALASAEVNFWFTLPEETTRRSSGRVWRKVPDDILGYLGVGLL
jgi:hypothetical protein